MKHKTGFNRLDRMPAHRKALHRSMVTSLFDHERITTTKAKALEIRRTAEKMITRAKEDSVHNRRIIARSLYNEDVLTKLFKEIGPRMKDRQGGYTRVLKMGFRQHDNAEVVILELVDYKIDASKEQEKQKRKAEKKAARKEADREDEEGGEASEEKKDAPKKEPAKAAKKEPKKEPKKEAKKDSAKAPKKAAKKETASDSDKGTKKAPAKAAKKDKGD
jgi:large subunit ribosomal protein L17